MTHPILNRVPTVVFRPANDVGPQQLGDAFGPRLAVLRHRSRIRVSAFGAIAIAAAFALSSCSKPTPQELAAQTARDRAADEDMKFRECIDEVVGAFNSASVEVIHECRLQAKAQVAAQ